MLEEEEEEDAEEQGRPGRRGADLKTRAPHNYIGKSTVGHHTAGAYSTELSGYYWGL